MKRNTKNTKHSKKNATSWRDYYKNAGKDSFSVDDFFRPAKKCDDYAIPTAI